ncbi:hypothetical protein HK102_006379 [Quaeritorhiza haematococci]|nr:hypothetical protein HK102_006379 [Quaeritorhiza haematococci]
MSITNVEPIKSKLCKIVEQHLPAADINPINRKYFNDAVGELQQAMEDLIQVPKKPNVRYAEQAINNVISLKHTLKLIAPLRESLTSVQQKLLR